MYFGPARAQAYCAALASLAARHPDVASGATELVVLPSFVAIPAALSAAGTTHLQVGAQDLATEDAGAFTGEVSGAELAELGVTHVEVGHAERRRLFGEDDAVVRAKTASALRNGLVPLLCVGEASRPRPRGGGGRRRRAGGLGDPRRHRQARPRGVRAGVGHRRRPARAPRLHLSGMPRRCAPPSASASMVALLTSASSTAAAPAPAWWPHWATRWTGCSSGGSPTTRPPSRPSSASSPPPADRPFARGYAWCAARRCVTSQVGCRGRWRHDPRSRDMRCDIAPDRISSAAKLGAGTGRVLGVPAPRTLPAEQTPRGAAP